MKIRLLFATFIVLVSLSCWTDGMPRQSSRTAAGPVITVQPKDAEYMIKGFAEPLSVAASVNDGGALSYQWYKSAGYQSSVSDSGSSIANEFKKIISAGEEHPGTVHGHQRVIEEEKITRDNAKKMFYFSEVPGADASSYTPDTTAAGRYYYFCRVTDTRASGGKPVVVLSDSAAVSVVEARPLAFGLKSAPPDLTVSLNGVVQRPVSQGGGIRNYRISGAGTLTFSAAAYKSQHYLSRQMPLKNGRLEIKLENENGQFRLIGEYPTGIQPKSVYFSPDGKRLFVPLLGQHGVDVFRFDQPLDRGNQSLVFEKRLTVPGSAANGFVEALCDAKRRELWISNMEENKVHIYDLDTLNYKTSLAVGGVYPKVITQNPEGNLTVVSNWVTFNISVFDSDSKQLLRRIPVGGTPRGMAFSPDGRFLYTAIYDEPVIAVVDMNQNKVTTRYRFHQRTGAARHVIYRDGKLYVSDMYQGTVNILDASTGALLASRYVGYNINTIVLSPDGRRIIASSRGRNNDIDYTLPGPELSAVYILNAADLALEEKIWGRNQPTGLAVSPDGKYMVFTDFLDANLELYEDVSKR